MRTGVKLAAAAALAVAAIATGAPDRSPAPPDIPTEDPGPGELVCRLDRTSAAPGETVRITGLVRSSHNDVVREVWHRVVRISGYDKQAEGLKNLKVREFCTESPPREEPFVDLPLNLTTPGAFIYDVQTRRVKGKEFEFRAKVLGSYLIYMTWEFKTSRQRVESQPVLLVVKPPRDPQGRAVVRPEWLSEDDR